MGFLIRAPNYYYVKTFRNYRIAMFAKITFFISCCCLLTHARKLWLCMQCLEAHDYDIDAQGRPVRTRHVDAVGIPLPLSCSQCGASATPPVTLGNAAPKPRIFDLEVRNAFYHHNLFQSSRGDWGKLDIAAA